MIVNMHEHPGPHAEQHQAEEGIDVSVLLPVGDVNQPVAIEQAREHPDRFVAFIWPGYAEEWDHAAEVVARHSDEFGCRGVKFQPLLQHGYPDDERLYPMYEACVDRDLIVLWHCGIVDFDQEFGRPHLSRYGNSVPGVDRVAADFPELRLVIAHLGGNFIYEACVVAGKHENVWLDTAYLAWYAPRLFPPATPEAMIEHAARVAGPERVLYGYEGVSPEVVRRTELDDQAQAAILGGNAARLLDLPAGEAG
ncbi:MAG: amidohydrolase family protein [Armatimonadota bacterium]